MKSGVPPWVLISVAGITALATLLAATISGLIAYRTSRRSIEHAAEMARLDREAEAAAQHRSARRNAYAAYVTAGMTALRDISSAWRESATPQAAGRRLGNKQSILVKLWSSPMAWFRSKVHSL